MAQSFKLKTFDGSAIAGSTDMTVYTTPASTTGVVIGLSLANLLSNDITVDVKVSNNDGDNVFLVKNAPVPNGGMLEVVSGNKVILEASDSITVQSNTANSLDSTLSVMEIT